jgi:hypothetical protein
MPVMPWHAVASLASNQRVGGSNPSGRTNKINSLQQLKPALTEQLRAFGVLNLPANTNAFADTNLVDGDL